MHWYDLLSLLCLLWCSLGVCLLPAEGRVIIPGGSTLPITNISLASLFSTPVEFQFAPVQSTGFLQANITASGNNVRTLSPQSSLSLSSSASQSIQPVFGERKNPLVTSQQRVVVLKPRELSEKQPLNSLVNHHFTSDQIASNRISIPSKFAASSSAVSSSDLSSSTNQSLLLENPFASLPYRSSSDTINSLIKNLFGNFSLQSLPPEKLIFGSLPQRNDTIVKNVFLDVPATYVPSAPVLFPSEEAQRQPIPELSLPQTEPPLSLPTPPPQPSTQSLPPPPPQPSTQSLPPPPPTETLPPLPPPPPPPQEQRNPEDENFLPVNEIDSTQFGSLPNAEFTFAGNQIPTFDGQTGRNLNGNQINGAVPSETETALPTPAPAPPAPPSTFLPTVSTESTPILAATAESPPQRRITPLPVSPTFHVNFETTNFPNLPTWPSGDHLRSDIQLVTRPPKIDQRPSQPEPEIRKLAQPHFVSRKPTKFEFSTATDHYSAVRPLFAFDFNKNYNNNNNNININHAGGSYLNNNNKKLFSNKPITNGNELHARDTSYTPESNRIDHFEAIRNVAPARAPFSNSNVFAPVRPIVPPMAPQSASLVVPSLPAIHSYKAPKEKSARSQSDNLVNIISLPNYKFFLGHRT